MTQNPTPLDQVIADILPEERIAALVAAAKQKVGELAEDIMLSPKQFAALTGYSERTLQDMRLNGTGPDYQQGGIPSTPLPKKKRKDATEPAAIASAPGTNQHVKYRLRDIREWAERRKVSNVRDAAIAKGQLFRTVGDLGDFAPFYVDPRGNVAGLVERGTFADLLSAEDDEIEFLPIHEGASRTWTDLKAHKRLAKEVRALLSLAGKRLTAAVEASEVASVTREAPSGRRKRLG
jgi:hypothetical protein